MTTRIAVPHNARAFTRRLLRWFRAEGRHLPWRATRDPYSVLVSEFMLQQTQVSRVSAYYSRFLKRFPTIERLAKSKPRAVRDAWDGLGYYRRAAHLHRLARTVVQHHHGIVPDDVLTLQTLPGVGRYTAGAVASFAYERRVPAVDTNVDRVLRRVFRPRSRSGAVKTRDIWNLAARVLPKRPRTVWEFNQALMDLGSAFCTARKPHCGACPVRPSCRTGRTRHTVR